MYTESTLTIENQPKRTYYFHCVWGWGGMDNGYFTFEGRFTAHGYVFEDINYISDFEKDIY